MDRNVDVDSKQNRKYIIRNKMITVVVKSTNNDFETPHSKEEYLLDKHAHYWVCRKLNVLGSDGWTPISSEILTKKDRINPDEMLVHIIFHLTRQIEDASGEYVRPILQEQSTEENLTVVSDEGEYSDTEE